MEDYWPAFLQNPWVTLQIHRMVLWDTRCPESVFLLLWNGLSQYNGAAPWGKSLSSGDSSLVVAWPSVGTCSREHLTLLNGFCYCHHVMMLMITIWCTCWREMFLNGMNYYRGILILCILSVVLSRKWWARPHDLLSGPGKDLCICYMCKFCFLLLPLHI